MAESKLNYANGLFAFGGAACVISGIIIYTFPDGGLPVESAEDVGFLLVLIAIIAFFSLICALIVSLLRCLNSKIVAVILGGILGFYTLITILIIERSIDAGALYF